MTDISENHATIWVGSLETTPGYLLALGRLTIHYSELDRCLGDLFQRITSLDPLSATAVEANVINAANRIRLLEDVIGARVDDPRDQAKL